MPVLHSGKHFHPSPIFVSKAWSWPKVLH